MLGVAKLAFKTYGAVSSVAGAIRHPIKATQDAVRAALVKLVVKAVIALAGERVADELARRVTLEQPVDATLRIPTRLQDTLLDPDTLSFVTNLANDALAAPLALLGLRLGTFSLTAGDEAGTLHVTGSFRLSGDSVAGSSTKALPLAPKST